MKESGETAVNRLGIPPRNVTTQSDSKEEHKLTKVQELLLKFSNKSVNTKEASNVNTQTKSKYKPAKNEDLCTDKNIKYEEDNKATTNRNKVREDSFKFDMKFERKFVATVNEEDLQSIVIKNMKTSSQFAAQEKKGRQPAVQTSKEDKEDILDEKTAAQDSISLPKPVKEAAIAAVRVPSGTTTTRCRCVLWQSNWNGVLSVEYCVPPITSGEN